MSEVKRCYYTGSLMVLASDYDCDTQALKIENENARRTGAYWKEEKIRADVTIDELRAQVEAMRDLLRKVAPHFAAPPGLGYLYQQIDIALQVNQMNKYQVKFFYLATGMEGHADIRSYGIIEASSAEEAVNKVIEANYSSMSNEDKNFLRGCLSATLVPDNENRSE